MDRRTAKPVIWLVDTRTTLKSFPQEVQDEIGYALYLAQIGDKYERAKPLRGLGPGVLEVVSDHRGDTFRGVYTVRFAEAIYVLHVFLKKSTKAIATPKAEVDLIRKRLKRAAELHEQQKRD